MSQQELHRIAGRGICHIFIRNLEFNAQIGVYHHEHGKTQPIRINIDLSVEDALDLGDDLTKVVDYGVIERKTHALIVKGHTRLVETLAERIANACLEDPRVKTARVRVEKLHALAGAESAGVEIERSR